jgi:predicted RecB family nuclease
MAITYHTPISELGLTTQAPKTLAEAGITTVGQLLDHTRDTIAELHGMGAGRLADIERALAEHRLSFGTPLPDLSRYATCKTCPACPECGNPRAQSARSVVTDLHGRAVHIGHRVGPVCDGCDRYHRALFAAVAA